jgi:hypothetical protein
VELKNIGSKFGANYGLGLYSVEFDREEEILYCACCCMKKLDLSRSLDCRVPLSVLTELALLDYFFWYFLFPLWLVDRVVCG